MPPKYAGQQRLSHRIDRFALSHYPGVDLNEGWNGDRSSGSSKVLDAFLAVKNELRTVLGWV